jgi:hypothetical protein
MSFLLNFQANSEALVDAKIGEIYFLAFSNVRFPWPLANTI